MADVTLGPREEQIDLSIRAVPDTTSQTSDSGAHAHGHEAPPLDFPYSGRIRDKKIGEHLVADWDVNARKAKLDYTISLYGVTSEPSKKVAFVAGLNHSG